MKTRSRMGSPNGNKLTGGRGVVKSSRPAGMVVVQWGSFVAITGVGKSSCPAGLLVAEACVRGGHDGVSSPSVSSVAGGGCLCGWQCVWAGGVRVIGVGAGMQGNVGLMGRQWLLGWAISSNQPDTCGPTYHIFLYFFY